MARFQTTADVADLLQVPKRTVAYWVKEGDLTGFLAGRKMLFESTDVEAFIARRKAERSPKRVA